MAQEPLAGRPTRRWPRRLLIGVNVFVAVALIATASAYAYFKIEYGRIPKLHLGKSIKADSHGGAMNVLVVGSDSRANIAKSEQQQFGSQASVSGERSDTIILLHVDPRQKQASILSIPRDLYVHISGTNESDRINSAFAHGPAQLIATLKDNLGIDINHYVEVDFNSFREIVDAVGSIPVYFPSPARDPKTGLDVRRPGCVQLDGNGSLKYVRSRHYEYYESGRWRVDPSGDLGRIQRQQDFIRRMLRKVVSRARNPLIINSLIQAGIHNVKVDSSLSTKDVERLASRFRSLKPDAVQMLTLPADNAAVHGASVLKLKQPDATQVINRFLDRLPPVPGQGGPLPRILPNSIRIRVLNGTGTSGQATEVAQGLGKANFNVAGTGDADSFRYLKSVIRYGSGQLPAAQALQPYIGGGAQLREDLTLRDVNLVLITGADFGSIRGGPGTPGAGGPSTTATTAASTAKPGTPANKGAPPQPQC